MHPQPDHFVQPQRAPLLSTQELAALLFDAPAPDLPWGDEALLALTRPGRDSATRSVDRVLTHV
jgi:hypothetical protein